jgi:hypothetical protein
MAEEWVEPDWDPDTEQEFQLNMTALDLGKVDLIMTPSLKAAEWAKARGYRIEAEFHRGDTLYTIWPGDQGV